jgi:hypothetical protein
MDFLQKVKYADWRRGLAGEEGFWVICFAMAEGDLTERTRPMAGTLVGRRKRWHRQFADGCGAVAMRWLRTWR